MGCRCLHKNVVDWCGCSPNDFTLKYLDKLKAILESSRPVFFARKFEAVKSVHAVNAVEQFVYGPFKINSPSLTSYWHNLYSRNHASTSDDSTLTFVNSAMRVAANMFSSIRDEIVPIVPLQAHSYHINDTFKALIVEFSVRTKFGNDLSLEVFLQKKDFSYFVSNHSISPFIQEILLNSDFDVKEQIFRNFGSHLGPLSEFELAIFWQDLKPDLKEVEFEVFLFDTNQTISNYSLLKCKDFDEACTLKFDLKKPLKPGIWFLVLATDDKLLFMLPFAILPLQFYHGKRVSVAESRFLNENAKPQIQIDGDVVFRLKSVANLPMSSKNESSPFYFKIFLQMLKSFLNFDDFNSLRTTVRETFLLTDSLIRLFYHYQRICVVNSPLNRALKVLNGISSCRKVSWSSYAPDPKTFWSDLDPISGRLRDSHDIRI